MSITIFRKIRGRTVPIVINEEYASEYLETEHKITPRHEVNTRKFDSNTSFTVPNAICQSCGKSVFYYENSYGSRVLFDSLGPPWPIHPCYNLGSTIRNNDSYTTQSDWEPVFIDRGIVTSNGSLRVQGELSGVMIIFSFEASVFSKMKIDVSDAPGLIVFASREKKIVQTHTGKKIFRSRYELKPDAKNEKYNTSRDENGYAVILEEKGVNFHIEVMENEIPVIKYIIPCEAYIKYFSKNNELKIKTTFSKGMRIDKARSDSHGMFITLNEISKDIQSTNQKNSECELKSKSLHIVGSLVINSIELIYDHNENMTVIINGNLNKKIGVTYSLSDNSKVNDIYKLFGGNSIPDEKIKCFVRDTEDAIALEIPYGNNEEVAVLNVSYLNKKMANKISRIKSEVIFPKRERPLILHRKKNKTSLEECVDKLVKTINSSMADAFINAKKK